MDFAVYLGDERTIIYKRGQGIVLNEPTCIAHSNGKVLAVGKAAIKLYDKQAKISIDAPVIGGRIIATQFATALFTELFKKVTTQSIALKKGCLICIPSSLSTEELNDYKTVVYTAGVADAEFIPSTIANAVGRGYDILSDEAVCLSIVLEADWADITAIQNGEIIAGGTLDNVEKLEDVKKQITSEIKDKRIQEYLGDRLSVIYGAGKLLENEYYIKKIIKAN